MHPNNTQSTTTVARLVAPVFGLLLLLLYVGCTEEVAPPLPAGPGTVGATGVGGAMGVGGATGVGGAGVTGTVGTTGIGGAQMVLTGGVGGMPGVQCQPGFTLCNGICVDLLSATDNCGVCGNPCPEGRVCANGACSADCVAPYTQCGTLCANLSNNANNCGACGTVCELGVPCVGGACGCPDGTLLCQGQCVDPTSNAANCGGCGLACGPGQACIDGACACPGGTVDCNGQCVSLDSPLHCGGCNVACAVGQICSPNGCIAETDGCPAGTSLCSGSCVNTLTSAAHCGACDTPCNSQVGCQSGTCGCPAGQTQCGGTCVNTSTSSLHCGACDNACTIGQACSAGTCQCSDEMATLCGNSCANLQTDPANCGACGTVCDGYPCTEGECRCPEGETLCDGACVILESEPTHCGECGNACPDGETCIIGTCSGAVGDACSSELAGGISITDIAIYQAGKIPVMAEGTAIGADERDVDVVAGKNAMLRAFVQLEDGWQNRVVSARLSILDGGEIEQLFHKQTVSGNSQESSLATTFNIEVPGELITPTAEYMIEIVECDTPVGALFSPRFPETGQVPIEPSNPGTLLIEFIPISANGITAASDTGRLDLYRDYMEAMYPVDAVEYTVGDTMNANSNISANGNGWAQVLQQLSQLHQSNNAPNDVYYYGLLQPADTLRNYCQGGCVAGIGYVPGTNSFSTHQRVSMGISYNDESSASTMAHEVGHNHGREHAPCGGASGVDQNFPHPNAAIGWWGFIWPDQLVPSDAPDIMAYCNGPWVSDYTYQAMLDRVNVINGNLLVKNPNPVAQWRVIVQSFEGLFWGVPPSEPVPAEGDPELATVVDSQGVAITQVTVYRSRMAHVDGASIMVPEPEPGWHAIVLPGFAALAFGGSNSSIP